MKTSKALLFMLLTIVSGLLFAQEADREVYILIDYMKPIAGNSAKYVKMEQEIFRKIHQERIKSGEITGWNLYQVQYPRGADAEYDYVTITTFADFGSIDEDLEEYEEIVLRAHPDKSLDEVNGYAASTRKLVRSDVFRSLDHFPLNNNEPAGALLVDFMKVHPKSENEYVKLEMDIWRPLHKLRQEENQIKSWGLYVLQFPGGTNYPYSYATMTGFENWLQIKDSWPEDLFPRVHPNADEEALVHMTHETRDLYSSQIWKLIDHISAEMH